MKLLICYSSKWDFIQISSLLSIDPTIHTLQVTINEHNDNLVSTYHLSVSNSNSNNLKNGILSTISKNDDIFSSYDHVLVIGYSPVSTAIALTCFHLNKIVIHLNAGIYNSIISKLASVHLCYSDENSSLLIQNNNNGSVFVTGNPIIDIVKLINPSIKNDKNIFIHLSHNHSDINIIFEHIDQLTKKFPDFSFILYYTNTQLQPPLDVLPSVSAFHSIEFNELVTILSKTTLVLSDNDELLDICSFLQKKMVRFIPDINLNYTDPNISLCSSIHQLVQSVSQAIPLSYMPYKCLNTHSNSSNRILNILSSLYNPIDCKFLSISNYRFLQPIQSIFAFIITSKITNNVQNYLLIESIRHIRQFYPQHTIYLIDDQSIYPLKDNHEITSSNVYVIDSIAKSGGEINPYLFALDPRCKHETLVYLHDSAFIKAPIEPSIIACKQSFLPIWYSKKFIWDDVFDPINQPILTSLLFYFDDLTNTITLHNLLVFFKTNPKLNFFVTFSGMSIFHQSFVQFIKKYTNFFSITHLFTNRRNRCLFERILSCIYFWIYRTSYISSVCGDINAHPMCFKNSNVYISNYHNVFLKVWQGR